MDKDVFIDTSALVKVYYKEKGSEETLEILQQSNIVYLSEISIIEFKSAIFRKLRRKELHSIDAAKTLINVFTDDFDSYKFVTLNSVIINAASTAMLEYGSEGLRTLDSIQLASILSLQKDVNFLCADNLLHGIISKNAYRSMFDYNI
ncbi:MAG: type II toxin-antitoxin system VapC family toxin [Cytophagales bacterium]